MKLLGSILLVAIAVIGIVSLIWAWVVFKNFHDKKTAIAMWQIYLIWVIAIVGAFAVLLFLQV